MIRSNPEEMIRKTMAKFVDKEVIPIARELDEKGEFPEALFKQLAHMESWESGILKRSVVPAETQRSTVSPCKN